MYKQTNVVVRRTESNINIAVYTKPFAQNFCTDTTVKHIKVMYLTTFYAIRKLRGISQSKYAPEKIQSNVVVVAVLPDFSVKIYN